MAKDKSTFTATPPVLLANNVLGDYQAEYDAPDPATPEVKSPPSAGTPPTGVKGVLAQLGLSIAHSLGDSLTAHFSPEVYQQQQESLRQKMQLAQQLQMHNMMTPHEKAQLAQHAQDRLDALHQQDFENRSKLVSGIANGTLQPASLEGTVLQGLMQHSVPPQAGGGAPGPGVGNAPTPTPDPSDMIAQLQGLPQKTVAPSLSQAPAPFLQAGGLAANPVPGSTQKDLVPFDLSTVDPESEFGKQAKALGLKGVIHVPAADLYKHLQDAAEKIDLAKAKATDKKANADQLRSDVQAGHGEIDTRFSPGYYQALYHGKVDPFADNQRKALHTQLDAALAHDSTTGGNTQVTQALKAIREYQSPWEKMQEKADAKGSDIALREAQRRDTRADKSYQFNVGELDKQEKPVGDMAQRFYRLTDTINQRTPQADALVAPELLTVMAGGAGSGLRMNEAEINRIVKGRTNLESLKAALNKWQLDPTKGLSITDAQRGQIQDLVKAVGDKLTKKQKILTEARRSLVDSDDVHEHRQIMAKALTGLQDVDSPSVQDQLGVGAGGAAPKPTHRYNPVTQQIEAITNGQ